MLMQKAEKINGPKYSRTEEWTVDEWIHIPLDNPRQRDTARHAKQAKKKHLKSYHPVHARVQMAGVIDCPNGWTMNCYKVDGHTRAYLWQTGELERPQKLYVDIWECDNLEQVKDLYNTFDNAQAAEQTQDKIYGALREHEIMFSSPLLASNRFGNAMRSAYQMIFGASASRAVETHNLVSYWLPELLLLDDCEPTPKRFPSPVVVAALLTFRRYGPKIQPFWEAYALDAGVKKGFRVDAVQALDRRIEAMRKAKKISGWQADYEAAAYTVSATTAWLDGRDYSIKAGLNITRKDAFDTFLKKTNRTLRTW